MTFIPKGDGTLDDLFWRGIPNEMWGKVTSLDKLKELFPEIKILKEDSINDLMNVKHGQIIYGIQKEKQSPQYIAYECLNCHEIIAGPPKKEYYNTLGEHPLSGGVGSHVYCHNCNVHIKHNVLIVS